MNHLSLIKRTSALFEKDLNRAEKQISSLVRNSKFLVIGAAGSIGQAVTKEIFKRSPKLLHVVDISENNMVELVRDIRSSLGYINGDFRTFSLDCGGREFEALMLSEGPYDYVLNLSALKHVRSEKDPYTLMRLVDVNIFNTIKTVKLARETGAKKYFCVSTDKAANPVNMMGASKRIMEKFLMKESRSQPISMARFANVAFSDGSLLHGFQQRVAKRQPLAVPQDIKRYFVTSQEAGELCLMSCLLGENRNIFFPKLNEGLDLIGISEIADRYLKQLGFQPYACASEDEARTSVEELISYGKWPCFFFESDTTGEKAVEEFYTDQERLEMRRFASIGIILNETNFEEALLKKFTLGIEELRAQKIWKKYQIVNLFKEVLPEFSHIELDKFLDQKM